LSILLKDIKKVALETWLYAVSEVIGIIFYVLCWLSQTHWSAELRKNLGI